VPPRLPTLGEPDERMCGVTEESGLPEESVLRGLPEFEWSSSESVRYEVAVDILSQLVAACSARIAREQVKSRPDPAVIAECERLQIGFTQQRTRLRPTELEDIEAILSNAKELDRHIMDAL
jgi:hypothetical protein